MLYICTHILCMHDKIYVYIIYKYTIYNIKLVIKLYTYECIYIFVSSFEWLSAHSTWMGWVHEYFSLATLK